MPHIACSSCDLRSYTTAIAMATTCPRCGSPLMGRSHVHQRSDERYYSAFLDRVALDLYRPPRAG